MGGTECECPDYLSSIQQYSEEQIEIMERFENQWDQLKDAVRPVKSLYREEDNEYWSKKEAVITEEKGGV